MLVMAVTGTDGSGALIVFRLLLSVILTSLLHKGSLKPILSTP
jgi:hypothetical protein